MTIITKVVKKVMLHSKPDKLLVFSNPEETGATADAENDSADNLVFVQRQRRSSAAGTLLVFLLALLVMCLGMIGGVLFYRAYMRENYHRQWRGVCGFPYDAKDMDNEVWSYNKQMQEDENASNLLQALFSSDMKTGFNFDIDADMETDVANEVRKEQRNIQDKYFREMFVLDLEDESFADIQVPDFRDGRHGRYLHDFKYNQSAIIDAKAKHCFIMDLDRNTVAQPRDLFDIISKMYSGYYDINTDVVRKEMRVVLPALDDVGKAEVSPRIVNDCKGSNIYRLEKIVGGVMKRSIVEQKDEQKFGGMFGPNIVEYDLVNFEAVEAYEKQNQQQ